MINIKNMLSIIEIIQYWTNVMVMKATYKVTRFGSFEKSGSKPFSSLLSSALHITETHKVEN
jgi:hypothetical protein